MFVTTDSITKGACEEDSSWSDRLLVPDCPLFARKFPNETAPIVRDLFTDCRSKLGHCTLREVHPHRSQHGPLAGPGAWPRAMKACQKRLSDAMTCSPVLDLIIMGSGQPAAPPLP